MKLSVEYYRICFTKPQLFANTQKNEIKVLFLQDCNWV